MLNLPPHHLTWWTDRCLSQLPTHFPLRLIGLHHSTLSDSNHKAQFLKVLMTNAIYRRRFGRRPGLIDLSAEYFEIQNSIIDTCNQMAVGFEAPCMEPRGHTVIAEYEVIGNNILEIRGGVICEFNALNL
ncbi:hypothetical protein CCP1ISM_1460001 [Azospirillaceae bacterium]